MVLFTAIWIFWNKSASHDLLKITVTSLLFINLPDRKSQKHPSQTSAARARVPPDGCAAARSAARTRACGSASPGARGNVRAPGTRQTRTRRSDTSSIPYESSEFCGLPSSRCHDGHNAQLIMSQTVNNTKCSPNPLHYTEKSKWVTVMGNIRY